MNVSIFFKEQQEFHHFILILTKESTEQPRKHHRGSVINQHNLTNWLMSFTKILCKGINSRQGFAIA